MKIQHVRQGSKKDIIGTLAAILNEETNKVGIGFSVVMPGDTPCKKRGAAIAIARALNRRSNKVPRKLMDAHRDFVEHCANVRAFQGFEVPDVNSFEYTFEPLHEHKQHDPIKKFFGSNF